MERFFRILLLSSIVTLLFILMAGRASAQFGVGETPGYEFYDSTEVIKKYKPVERCHLIGVNYTVGFGSVYVTPVKLVDFEFSPLSVGVSYTYLQDLWNIYSYFGTQVGLKYNREGFSFKNRDNTPYNTTFYESVEMPFTFLFHYDIAKGRLRLLVNAGMFVGYRLKVNRTYLENPFEWEPTDIRFDYGIRAGAGIGVVLSPVEIHIEAAYKHSFSPLFEPNKNSEYYYEFQYPNQILITLGLHFQLGRKFYQLGQ